MGSEGSEYPRMDTKGKKIGQIGIVVQDAARTARRYSEIFGIGPWVFLDIHPTDLILHDKPRVEECGIRLALAHLGKIQFELLQPMYGPSTHMEFLQEHGEGVHHLSFGMVEDHDEIVSALNETEIGIEMQGILGGALTFTYLATQKELGTILEVTKPVPEGVPGTLKPWGTYMPEGSGLIKRDGKEIVQVGIVVRDAEQKAKKYWEVLGIGPWTLIDFKPPHVSDGVFRGVTMADEEIHVRAAVADLGDIQFELLEPVCGAGTHMDFLKIHGEGVHHVSFGVIDDHDEMLSAFRSLDIEVEMTGVLGGANTFTYLATQKDLGTIFELVKTQPGVESTLMPYGTYPRG